MRRLMVLLTIVGIFAGVGFVWATQAAEPAGGGTPITVDVFDFDYAPDPVIVRVGDTVQWQNTQGTHNVVSDDGLFDSGAAASGAWTYDFTFDTPGTYQYYCTIHGSPGGIGMSGIVEVLAPSSFLPVITFEEGSGPGPTPTAPGPTPSAPAD